MMAAALLRLERGDGFSDGLRAWIRGEDTTEAEAMGAIIGEIGVRWLKLLRSKFDKE